MPLYCLNAHAKFVLLLCLFAACFFIRTNAQQNLFNIPSGVITPKKEFFFQQQINAYDLNQWAAKSHFVFGLGKEWEVGFNITDVNIDFRREGARRETLVINSDSRAVPFKPNFLFTAQKSVQLHKDWRVNIGTQLGFNTPAPIQQTYLNYYTYGLLKWAPKHHTTLIAGPYIANSNIVGHYANLGSAQYIGYLFGFEYPLSHSLLLMGDYVSGVNSQSTAALGVNWYATKRLQFCLGALLPSPGSTNKYGVVFEINVLTYDDI